MATCPAFRAVGPRDASLRPRTRRRSPGSAGPRPSPPRNETQDGRKGASRVSSPRATRPVPPRPRSPSPTREQRLGKNERPRATSNVEKKRHALNVDPRSRVVLDDGRHVFLIDETLRLLGRLSSGHGRGGSPSRTSSWTRGSCCSRHKGVAVPLPPKPFAVLALLVRRPERLVPPATSSCASHGRTRASPMPPFHRRSGGSGARSPSTTIAAIRSRPWRASDIASSLPCGAFRGRAGARLESPIAPGVDALRNPSARSAMWPQM